MMTGEIYSLRLQNWDREKQALVELPAFGLVKAIALVDDSYFFAALDTFHASPTELQKEAPILIIHGNASLGRKGGANIFFHGPTLPDPWQHHAHNPLSDRELEIAQLYRTWKNKGLPPGQTLAAYEQLGSVGEGLSEMEASLAWEWRFRFDLQAIEKEEDRRQQRIAAQEKHEASWKEVAQYEVHFQNSSFQSHASKAYKVLIKKLKRKRKPEVVKKALSTFFLDLSTHDLSAEYRDEIVNIAKNVGQACDIDSKSIYDIFEKSRF